MAGNVRWGILSTGHIAELFAQAVLGSKTGVLAAVASRSLGKARAFAKLHGIPKAYGGYPRLIQDPALDAVYVATPHPFHAAWALKAMAAGKAVLCEKPLALHAPQVRRMVEEARGRRVFLMEAFMYRCHPQTHRLAALVRRKAIGDLKLIQASFCFERPFDPKSRLFNEALGGGAIWDVGCYPVSMARLLAGAALGKPFAEPLRLRGTGSVGEKSRVDEVALASLEFPGNILAELSCANRLRRPVGVTLYGTQGRIEVPSPWHADRFKKGAARIRVFREGSSPREIVVRTPLSLYSLEVDAVGKALRGGLRQSPYMSWADSLGNAKVLDDWRKALGL